MISKLNGRIEELWDDENGWLVESVSYDELRDLAIELHQWCLGHGKIYTDKDKEIAKKHDLF